MPREQEQHEDALSAVESWEGLLEAAAQRLAQAAGMCSLCVCVCVCVCVCLVRVM
jgi:hypothetical protein